jgi:hypothetical protein
MRRLLVPALSVSALLVSSAGVSADRNTPGQLHDRRTGQTVGEIRQHGERYYDVYDRRGGRRAYGVERSGVIEFYDARTSRRLPIEIRKDRSSRR